MAAEADRFGSCLAIGMRLPSEPEGLTNEPPLPAAVSREPSYPDRARIDSDVRAFLRPASSPWIVFNRDSRVDDFARAALRVGAVFASSPSLMEGPRGSADVAGSLPVMEKPLSAVAPSRSSAARSPFVEAGSLESGPGPITSCMWPSAGQGDPESAVEPSNVVVASDVTAEEAGDRGESSDATSSDAGARSDLRARLAGERRRALRLVVACATVLAGVSALALLGGRSRVKVDGAVRATEPAPAVAPEMPRVEPPGPTAASAPERAPVPGANAELQAPGEAPVPGANAERQAPGEAPSVSVRKRLGKLSIKADASHKTIWFDGKRMLGAGTRTFHVLCGMHIVAVNDKSDARDIEVPCDGEYVLSR